MFTGEPDIYIIGTGAIGKALAVFLKSAGRKVTLIRGSFDDGSIKTERIRVENGAGYEADIEIATLSALETIGGIVVLANKSYGNDRLAAVLKDKTGSSPVVLLQNGLGIEQPFLIRGFPEVYRCVLFVTSRSTSPAAVRFKPVSPCPIGIEKGGKETLNTIVHYLNTPRFAFRGEEYIQPVVWKKAIINSVFNSVCPLLETDNGVFHRNPQALEIARRIIRQCIRIAQGRGIMLRPEEVEESLLRISRSSDGQLISTLQDIRNHRQTEIGTLNLEIARIAGALGRGDLTRETRLLGELTRLKADISMLEKERNVQV